MDAADITDNNKIADTDSSNSKIVALLALLENVSSQVFASPLAVSKVALQTISALFLALFVYDALADAQGLVSAVWAPSILIAVPGLLAFASWTVPIVMDSKIFTCTREFLLRLFGRSTKTGEQSVISNNAEGQREDDTGTGTKRGAIIELYNTANSQL